MLISIKRSIKSFQITYYTIPILFHDVLSFVIISQTETAKEMIKESLPIKCLEAVILGIYLTNGVPGLERYPLSFRSVFGSNVHRHVVLVVSWNGLYGALGMSRREDLMYKPHCKSTST